MSEQSKVEKYETNKEKDDFDKYIETSDIFTGMQQHLTSHIGLSMGIITTILLIANNKAFVSSQLKYVIILMMIYSVTLLFVGYGEYIEKFIQFHKLKKDRKQTIMDHVFSIVYFVIGVIMLLVMSFLYYSIIKEKIV